ncbi:MAG: hypothetical protein R2729_30910 [Bryobacteraceae bacterium]
MPTRDEAGSTVSLRLPARLGFDKGIAACWWRTFFPSLGLFLLTAAFVVTKTGRDALFFQRGGLLDLPKAYLGIAVLSAPAAAIMLRLIAAFGPRRARVLGLCLMAALQCVFYAVAEPGGGWAMTLFFILVPLLYGVLLSIAWLLGADLLDRVPPYLLGRLYATIGASSMLGGFTGAAACRRMAASLQPETFLLVGAALLLLAAAVNTAAWRLFPVDVAQEKEGPMPAPPRVPSSGAVVSLLRHRYLALLAATGLMGAVVGVIIEFQFYAAVSSASSSSRDALRLFANLYMLLNGAAVLVQLVATPMLQRAFGVYGSLMILPASLFGVSAMVAWSATSATQTALRVAEGGIKSSIHRSNWEQSYLPVMREQRAAAKLLVDGMAARIGEGAAAAVLIASVSLGAADGFVWLNAVIVAGTVVWLGLAFLLRRSRRTPGLIPASDAEFRPDLPIPDG